MNCLRHELKINFHELSLTAHELHRWCIAVSIAWRLMDYKRGFSMKENILVDFGTVSSVSVNSLLGSDRRPCKIGD
jgi:hypothetical protein